MRISDWSSDVCSSDLATAELRFLHRDRHRELRDRVQEVGRAVERVDDEARLARLSLDLARLLHQETPAGTRVGQFVVQRAFGRLVGLRHEIGRPFLRNLQMLDLAKVARSEEHTSELPSLMRTSYAVFC